MLRIRVLTASVLAVALLLLLFVAPPRWTVAAFAMVFVLAAWEWSGFGLRGRTARLAYAAALAVLLGLGWRWAGDPGHLLWLLVGAGVWWLVAFFWLAVAPAWQRPGVTLLCGILVLVPAFIALARVLLEERGFAQGPVMVLCMLLLVFAADIGAYFAGRRLGRRKLAPRVSPGKTWEGAIGGLAAVAAVAAAICAYFGLPLLTGVCFGGMVGMFSIVGDLTESMFKRSAGLKDSSGLLPGHGGLLDRIDSVTAAAPLYALGLFGSGVLK